MKTKLPFVSKHVAGMVRAFAGDVRGLRFFNRRMTGINCPSVRSLDTSPKSTAFLGYTKNSGITVPHGDTPVLRVDGSCHVTQVSDSVIRRVSVYVVNVVARPLSGRVKPCQPMKPINVAFDAHPPIPAAEIVSSNRPNFNSITWLDSPRKNSSIGIVYEKFAHALCGKIGLSHAVVPCKQWFGQKPQSVIALLGLRYFTAGVA